VRWQLELSQRQLGWHLQGWRGGRGGGCSGNVQQRSQQLLPCFALPVVSGSVATHKSPAATCRVTCGYHTLCCHRSGASWSLPGCRIQPWLLHGCAPCCCTLLLLTTWYHNLHTTCIQPLLHSISAWADCHLTRWLPGCCSLYLTNHELLLTLGSPVTETLTIPGTLTLTEPPGASGMPGKTSDSLICKHAHAWVAGFSSFL
jgi:hypothetical protein